MTTTNAYPASALDYASPAPLVVKPLLAAPTFRNWVRTILWTLAVVGICLLLYLPDKYGVWFPFQERSRTFRLFKNPATLSMRVFGIPHFFIAFLFTLSSKRMIQARSKLIFAALTIAGAGLCYLFYRCGAHENHFAIFLFYFYFIIHGFRDDAFFFKTYGDMPQHAKEAHARIMQVFQWLSVGLLFSLLWPATAQLSSTNVKYADPIMGTFFPADWPFVVRLFSMFGPMAIIAATLVWRIATAYPGGPRPFWLTFRPLLMVYMLTMIIVLSSTFLGAWTFDFYILMHFVGWFLIALYLINRFPAKEKPAGIWPWMRTTRAGFITLHFGLVAITLTLYAISTYAFGRTDIVEKAISVPGFYFWTLMHVTWSFLPR
jgi:hypothetical protein